MRFRQIEALQGGGRNATPTAPTGKHSLAQSHMAQTRGCRDVLADAPMVRRLKSGHRTAEHSEYVFSSN
jgi:hypothetical protein